MTDQDSFISLRPTRQERGSSCRVLENKLAVEETTGRNEEIFPERLMTERREGW